MILTRPHVTEKASTLSTEDRPVYVFRVAGSANKPQIVAEFKRLFGVVPRLVRVVNQPGKKVTNRGRVAERSGFKKAYVFLKKGDKISLS